MPLELRRAVLVVSDDDKHVRDVLAIMSADGTALVHVRGVEEAWQRFDPLNHSAALIDVELPDGSGVDLYVWLKLRAPWVEVQLMFEEGSDESVELDRTEGERGWVDPARFHAIAIRMPPVPPLTPPGFFAAPEHIAAQLGMSLQELAEESAAIAAKLGADTLEEAITNMREQLYLQLMSEFADSYASKGPGDDHGPS
jgi:hypothetical protein